MFPTYCDQWKFSVFFPQVSFILSGEYDETDVRSLNDTKRKVLQRGNIDVFAMTCPRYVYDLRIISAPQFNSNFSHLARRIGENENFCLKYKCCSDDHKITVRVRFSSDCFYNSYNNTPVIFLFQATRKIGLSAYLA